MRSRMVAGCGLSLLLACVVPAMAQQRSLTCAQREQQIKSAQDDVATLSEQAVAQKTKCTPPGAARDADACGAYGAALTRQRERQRQLKELTDDPAWHRCPASAGEARYKQASIPNENRSGSTRSGDQPLSTGGAGVPGGNRSGGSFGGGGRGDFGSGSTSRGGSSGHGSRTGSGGGSSDLSPDRRDKGGNARHGNAVSAKISPRTPKPPGHLGPGSSTSRLGVGPGPGRLRPGSMPSRRHFSHPGSFRPHVSHSGGRGGHSRHRR